MLENITYGFTEKNFHRKNLSVNLRTPSKSIKALLLDLSMAFKGLNNHLRVKEATHGFLVLRKGVTGNSSLAWGWQLVGMDLAAPRPRPLLLFKANETLKQKVHKHLKIESGLCDKVCLNI